MKPDIYKIKPIGSGILFVMPQPSPHEWLEDDIRYLKDFGINRIISSPEKSEENEIGLANESALANKHSLEFVSYPVKIAAVRICDAHAINTKCQELTLSGKRYGIHQTRSRNCI
jgi:protein tyrosine phosphatase (PTP) superfamily phosphohydrolase (DUF442 family)